MENLRAQGNRWRDTICTMRMRPWFDERPISRSALKRPHVLTLPDEPVQVAEIPFTKESH